MEFKKVPVIHQTDCYHYHGDPDDHYDLACQFALAYSGLIDLKGILMEYPVEDEQIGDPAIAAVNQLNCLTGKFVPLAVGNEMKVKSEEDIKIFAEMHPLNSGLAMVFKMLEEAEEPVVIHMAGTARDIAIASMLRPDLFEKKCKAVYLNAGSAVENVMEANVAGGPYAFSRMFKLPCPLYWMPCFHEQIPNEMFSTNTYGTYWRFWQKEVFDVISENMKKYFAYALGKVNNKGWFSYLKEPVDKNLIVMQGEMIRNMWCTAGFLHAAGKTVTSEGKIVDIGTPDIKCIFDFVPIEVECTDDGRTSWKLEESNNRYIFKILDLENYVVAMTKALGELLSVIP